MIVGQDLKLSEIRRKKKAAEEAIVGILCTFVNETGVKISNVDVDLKHLKCVTEDDTFLIVPQCTIQTKI